jgi:homoserine/homoserine lactone efflux protein
MRFELWSVYLLATLLASLTPGPAVLLSVSTGLAQGFGRALWTILGICIANILYLGGAGLGMGAILAASTALFLAIRWAGAAYLIWLGLRALLAHGTRLEIGAAQAERSIRRLVGEGFLLQVTNPKAYVYVTAILPQFIEIDRPLLPQMLIITATSLAAELLVLGSYAALGGRARRMTLSEGFVGWANRAAGIVLILAGLMVVAIDWL